MLVVDASVVAKWLIEEAGSDQARALVDGPEALCAPELLLAEIGNLLWRKIRLGETTTEQAIQGFEALRYGDIDLASLTDLHDAAFGLSRALDHPIYDCYYLSLAERQDAPLVTADRRFLQAVAGTAFADRVRLLGAP